MSRLIREAQSYEKRIAFFSDLMLKNEVGAVLFLGCGPGYESFCYSRNRPQALTIGIDLNHKEFDREVAKYVGFIVCDGAHLPFRNGAFDWEYCAHVLEHMPEDIRTPCVQEIRRTVKHGVLIACPNANRIVSYINSAEKVSLFDVIKWNLFDWLHRLKGDFQNYHRGFTEYELNTMLSNSFHRVYCATVEYDFYMTDKTRYEVLFRVLNKIGLLRRVSPALTFICKPQTI